MMTTDRGRLTARAALTLGIVASVAANVAHARAGLGPRLAAGFAPLAVYASVEVLARVAWRHGFWWGLGRWCGSLTVGLVAAVASYVHQRSLLLTYGEEPLPATLIPLSVDGLMLLATVALIGMGGRGEAEGEAEEEAPDAEAEPEATAPPAPEAQPEARPARNRKPRPETNRNDTAARVARERKRNPEATQAEIAAKLKVTDRTARKYWTTDATPSPNGKVPA